MTYLQTNQGAQEAYEYHGSTAVAWVRKKNGMVERQWLYFDSVQEAADFFYDYCACCEAA
jgi:hypothetical protein